MFSLGASFVLISFPCYSHLVPRFNQPPFTILGQVINQILSAHRLRRLAEVLGRLKRGTRLWAVDNADNPDTWRLYTIRYPKNVELQCLFVVHYCIFPSRVHNDFSVTTSAQITHTFSLWDLFWNMSWGGKKVSCSEYPKTAERRRTDLVEGKIAHR